MGRSSKPFKELPEDQRKLVFYSSTPTTSGLSRSKVVYLCKLILNFEATLGEDVDVDSQQFDQIKRFEEEGTADSDPYLDEKLEWDRSDFNWICSKVFNIIKRNPRLPIERRNCIMYLAEHSNILKKVPAMPTKCLVSSPFEIPVCPVKNENPGSSNAIVGGKTSTMIASCVKKVSNNQNLVRPKVFGSNEPGSAAAINEGSVVESKPVVPIAGTPGEMVKNPLFSGSGETRVTIKEEENKKPSSENEQDDVQKDLFLGNVFYIYGKDETNLKGHIEIRGGVVSSEISEGVRVISLTHINGTYPQSLADLLEPFTDKFEVKVYMGALINDSIYNREFDYFLAYELDPPAEATTPPQKQKTTDDSSTLENAPKKRKLTDDTMDVQGSSEPGNPPYQSMIGKLYPFKPAQPKATSSSYPEVDYMDFIKGCDDEAEKEDESSGDAVDHPSDKDHEEQGKTRHDSSAEYVLNVFSKIQNSGQPKLNASKIAREIHEKWNPTACTEQDKLVKTQPEEEDANGTGRSAETKGTKGVLAPGTIRNHIMEFEAQVILNDEDANDEEKRNRRNERKSAVLERGVGIDQLVAVLDYIEKYKKKASKK